MRDLEFLESLQRLSSAETAVAPGALGTTIRPRATEPMLAALGGAETLAAPLVSVSGARAIAAMPQISITLPDAAPEAPRVARAAPLLPDLEVTGLLGEGGMGRVHAARQRSLARDVAIKTLKPDADDSAAAALLAEGVITGQLEHPAIVPVHALGVDHHGRPVLVMKRVEGAPWRDLLHDPQHPMWSAWGGDGDRLVSQIEILMELCNAAHFAHRRGVVHRDIKPDNVMLGHFGEVYLVDWGIAVRLGADGLSAPQAALAGTPVYMAPEMMAGRALDARTDVYLLGATLHEVLTGRPRHEGESLAQVLRAAFASEPYRYEESVPEELARLCNHATHRDPAARPQSARELQQLLSGYLRHRSSFALCESAGERLAELRALLEAASKGGDLDDLPRWNRLATECRFGFLQALREWDENDSARRGLRGCLEATVEVALRREDGDGARALLAELEGESPALEARVEELERRLADRRREAEELRRMAHEMDASVSVGPRLVGAVVLGLLGAGISLYAMKTTAGLTRLDLLRFSLFLAVTLAVPAIVLRRPLLKNAFNRRISGLVVLGLGMVIVNRLVALKLETPVPQILAQDSLLLSTALSVGALTLFRWLAWGALALLAAAAFATLAPELAAMAFSLGTTAVCVFAVVSWRAKA